MSYQLGDDVSFCVAEGHLIFLDVRRDRYLSVGATTEQAFAKLIDDAGSDAAASTTLRPLIDAGLLVRGDAVPKAASTRLPIERSVMNEWDGCAGISSTVQMLAAQSLWRGTFKQFGLHGAVHRLRRVKARASRPVDGDLRRSERRLIASFLMAGQLFDNRDKCLLRSFTLVASLAKRGCAVDLVFGVRASPFGAHCWAQHGDTVLNDSVDHARQFTPILVL